jgi:hypothetical protein
MKTRHPKCGVWLEVMAVAILSLAPSIAAQTAALERTMDSPKADVERALHELHAYSGGRLPALLGFANAGSSPLSHFQEGRFDYMIEVTAISGNRSSVRIAAQITALCTDDDSYRQLSSNGRLETDLFDRLGNALHLKSAAEKSPASLTSTAKTGAHDGLPDSPSVTKAEALASSRFAASKREDSRRDPADISADARIQELTKQKKNLEEVLQHQVRPSDLVVVLKSGTPVRARPAENAEVIMYAEAEDEFQILERQPTWVHVQLSGPARGWILSSQLDASGVSMPVTAPAAQTPAVKSPHAPRMPYLQKTREESGTFPGKWEPLRGKKVQIIWVQPDEHSKGSFSKQEMASLASLLHQEYSTSSEALKSLAGVVVVVDSADGGMMATTLSVLRQWNAGGLSDQSFWRQCWFDPPDAFPQVRRASAN